MTTFHPGTNLVRNLLLGEATLSAVGGLGLIFAPSIFSTALAASPSSISPLSEHFLQWYGVCNLGFSVLCVLGYPNTTSGIVARRVAYTSVGAVESMLIPVLLWQASRGVLDRTAVYSMVGGLVGLLSMRVYTTVIRPELAGYLVDEKKEQ